jgi:glycosyltransferase involved in cell wall biosynthesis
MSKVVAVLLTYNRREYAEATIKSVTPKPHLHISDDGSPDGYVRALEKVAKQAGAPAVSYSYTLRDQGRSSYGNSFNLASQLTHNIADYLVMLEDDWQLLKPLNLVEYVQDLEAVPEIDCIRLGYLSWTQPIGGRLVCGPNHKYLLIDPASPEPHVFAGHPRLERVSYQRAVGPWPEGVDPNQTEFLVSHMPRARQGVAWPLGLDAREGYGLFAHIGTLRARD